MRIKFQRPKFESLSTRFSGLPILPAVKLVTRLRNRHFLLLDLVLLTATPAVALWLRVGWPDLLAHAQPLVWFTILGILLKLPIFFVFRFYASYWRYASIDEMSSIINGVLAALAANLMIFLGLQGSGLAGAESLPRSLPLIDALLTLLVVAGPRFSARMVEVRLSRATSRKHSRRVLIVGAGDAGEKIVREILTSSHTNLFPVGFLDDDPHKWGVTIHGVRVLGGLEKLRKQVSEYKVKEVIIAMPTAPGKTIRQVVRLCEQAEVPSRILPGIYELLNGQVSVSRIRNVEIGDLLRRDPVKADLDRVRQMIAGKRVLVTGAGGSIGAELCTQIIGLNPAALIAVGHGENSLFNLCNHLTQVKAALNGHGQSPVIPVLADVRDRPRLETVFKAYRPDIVFHAAAHKHVPLTEANLDDAITTNVLGTRNLVDLSVAHGVERFVLISTDKAVNPVNVLGRTKRLAELLVRQAHEVTGRPFVAVRFGNVLGSRGSVVPYFQSQIAAGGPVTVTHPDMSRFFMTIPEAVQLVLQAATLGARKEIFVLDMGEPVRIVDLAQDLIELSGYKVGQDIEIAYTGLRPGEKLYEELFNGDECSYPTGHPKILMARCEQTLPSGWLNCQVEELVAMAQAGRLDAAHLRLEELTATPHSQASSRLPRVPCPETN